MTLVLAEAVKNINIAVVQINSNKLFLHDGQAQTDTKHCSARRTI